MFPPIAYHKSPFKPRRGHRSSAPVILTRTITRIWRCAPLCPAAPRSAPLCPATPSPDVRFTRSTAVRTCRLFQRHQNVIYVFSSCNTRVPTVFCYARGKKGTMVNDSDGCFIYIFYRFQRGRYKSDLYGK